MPLGRGLGSLIPQQNTTIKPKEHKKESALGGGGILMVPVSNIVPNPKQPREYFADNAMEDLVSSIKEHGILQPLVVSPLGEGKYELIAGERRFRAAKFNKMKEVPAIIREAKEHEKLELALIENLQRQDLNAIEEAKGYQQLIDQFGFSHENVAKKMGKSRPVVSNTLRLLKLSPEIQEALMKGKISATAGRVLAGVTDPKKQKEIFKKMLEGLTVQEGEVRRRLSKPEMHTRRNTKDGFMVGLEDELREKLKTKVNIGRSGKTYKLTLECYSQEELEKMSKRLLK